MVLHEEHHQPKCSSRPPSRKSKAKKIPQRGLGVAQLEKLRIQELQKSSSSNTIINTPAVSSSSSNPQPLASSNDDEIKYLSSLWGDEISNLNVMNSKAAPGMSLLQAEPPSNQNHTTISSARRDEERVVGTNLPWPFQPETAVSFPYKAPQFSNQLLKPEESMSIYGKSYKSMVFSKEGASSSNSYVEWRNSEVHINKRLKESLALASADNGLLTLGSSATQHTSKLKQPMAALPEFPLLQSQGGIENASASEKTFYSFLPIRPAARETDENKWGDETGGGVDTSLKL